MKYDFIVTSDIHADDRQPVSRIDNYWETLKGKIIWLREFQKSLGGIPIIDSGDLLNSWRVSPLVESWLIENLPQPFYTIIGNHEMPYHNKNLFSRSSLNVLVKAGAVQLLSDKHRIVKSDNNKLIEFFGVNYGDKLNRQLQQKTLNNFYILIMHEMVTEEKTNLFESKLPKNLLEDFPEFDIIISGHNHKRFDYLTEDHRYFLSPGSFTRMSSDQTNYLPAVHCINIEKEEIHVEHIPIKDDVWDIKSIEHRKTKDEKIQKFVDSLVTDYKTEVNFEKNMETFIEKNNIRNGVREEIYAAIEKK